ncbi:MAG: cation:proton antiporter [Myxococcaceae bacterium]|nr:cation:proton antiporter [Myxococcaceae bacterium]
MSFLVDGGLLAHLVTALVAALAGAALAARLRLPLILGYLGAGIAIGPFTPGVIGNAEAIAELAEVGVILLMFAIGVQLSLRELLAVGRVAVVGGLVQVALIVGLGVAVGAALGWPLAEAWAYGAVLSNSSSTVMSRLLADRGALESPAARIGLAWSSVQDVSSIVLVAAFLFIVPSSQNAGPLLGKAAVFFLVVVPAAFWVVPRVLRRVSATGSRELFALSVMGLALVMALGASSLGVSLALGAFLAGVVVGESDLAHRVLGDVTPMRDVFSGVFFVSIGMLLDPRVLVDQPVPVLLTLGLLVGGKGLATIAVGRGLGLSPRVATLLGGALAQSAEFSFLMAGIARSVGALSAQLFDVLLVASVLSIVLAPAVNALAAQVAARLRPGASGPDVAREAPHAIVCGHGRVGQLVVELMRASGVRVVVVDEDQRLVRRLREDGVDAVVGDAGHQVVLERAGVRHARLLVLCVPDRLTTRRAVELAKGVNPDLAVLARTHTSADREVLKKSGATDAVIGEVELALSLSRQALGRFEVPVEVIDAAIETARRA